MPSSRISWVVLAAELISGLIVKYLFNTSMMQ